METLENSERHWPARKAYVLSDFYGAAHLS